MVNYNGNLLAENNPLFTEANRAFRYGDGLFETIRGFGETLFFWEDHYLRLMASMRILRMEIPMNFTMEFLSDEIRRVIEVKDLNGKPVRIRLTVFRNDGGKYSPISNEVSYIISAEEIADPFFVLNTETYRVELFKEHYLNTGLLSTLKTNNRIVNVVGSVYAMESQVDNFILLNHRKQVVEGLNGNLFLINGDIITTPPLSDGCINGIVRKKLIEILKKDSDYELMESSISPFELQKADELFLTNAIMGIQPVTHYRRKNFNTTVAQKLVAKLNANARIN
ncbi:MAG: aminotransferase class IV [Flavobacteriaceae bacterium]